MTQKTAAELITARANRNDATFGLLHWKGASVRKQDILTAKNYLTEDEIDTLSRLVVIFLETAELRTKSRQEIRMGFWRQNVDHIISSNGFPLLGLTGNPAGSMSHAQVESTTNALYLDYDQRRRKQEALEADRHDEADLKALENKIKRRPKK